LPASWSTCPAVSYLSATVRIPRPYTTHPMTSTMKGFSTAHAFTPPLSDSACHRSDRIDRACRNHRLGDRSVSQALLKHGRTTVRSPFHCRLDCAGTAAPISGLAPVPRSATVQITPATFASSTAAAARGSSFTCRPLWPPFMNTCVCSKADCSSTVGTRFFWPKGLMPPTW
jgi:hypothetical protein